MSRFSSIPELVYHYSTRIVVEETEEFLDSLNIKNFVNPRILDIIRRYLPKHRTASGSFGSVYSKPEDDFIVKVIPICQPDTEFRNSVTARLCNIAKGGSLIFKVPYTISGKEMIIAPNYVTEYIINVLLYEDLRFSTPCIPRVDGYQYSPGDTTAYVVMEKLEPLVDFVDTQSGYLYFISQILLTLDMAQRTGKFVHRDLHTTNIMARPRRQKIVPWSVGEDLVLFTRMSYDAVMIDFGLSRYETRKHVLSPSLVFSMKSEIDMIDYYQFTPYYDVLSFVSGLVNDKHVFKFKPSSELLKFLVDSVTEGKGLEEFVTQGGVYWRPNPTVIGILGTKKTDDPMKVIETGKVNSPMKVASDIASFILKSIQGNFEESLFKNGLAVAERRPRIPKFIRGDQVYRNTIPRTREDTTFYNYVIRENDRFNNVIVKTMRDGKFRKDIRPFNMVVSVPASISGLGDQVIHVAAIDQNVNNGYTFGLDCCKVDTKMYFQSHDILGGVVINASFFRYKTDYLPIGHYKFGTYKSYVPIPVDYANKLYALIGIDYDGKIHIDNVTQESANKYYEYFTCGPILVWDGKLLITENTLLDPRLSCRKPKTIAETKKNKFDDGVLNCNLSEDGDLRDLSNPRPRSALCINSKGIVILVYVEGRDKKGVGMDASQLAEYCLSIGAKNAVALGDGIGAGMVWKNPDEDVVCLPNRERTYSFPVGTILSYSLRRSLSPSSSLSDDVFD